MQAKKSLGQNWLKSESVARAMIGAADLHAGETVIEIGPGTGFLTKFLLETGVKVIAVEKDDRAINLLREKFRGENLELIHGDVLSTKFDLVENYKLVANIPYYLTGQILRQFLAANHQPSLIVLMLQDEVAKRIIAKNHKESLLSISVKAYGSPKYVKRVAAKNFSPAPAVDSAILLISNINKNNFHQISAEKFFAVVKQGFASKRKMLRNHLGVSPDTFLTCNIKETARAENLNLPQWLCLATHSS